MQNKANFESSFLSDCVNALLSTQLVGAPMVCSQTGNKFVFLSFQPADHQSRPVELEIVRFTFLTWTEINLEFEVYST